MTSVSVIDELILPEDESPPNYEKANRLIKEALGNCTRCNGNERANLYLRLGFVEYYLENIHNAIAANLEIIREKENIPIKMERDALKMIAKLNISIEEYRKAKNYFALWEATCPTTDISEDYFYRLAHADYELKEYTESMENLNTGIKILLFDGRFIPRKFKSLKVALELELYGEIKSLDYAKEIGRK